jgi:hypothetical protein
MKLRGELGTTQFLSRKMTLTLSELRPVVLESAVARIVEYTLMTNSKELLSVKKILRERTAVILPRDPVLQIAEARRAYPQASASLASRREANYRIRKSYPNLWW